LPHSFLSNFIHNFYKEKNLPESLGYLIRSIPKASVPMKLQSILIYNLCIHFYLPSFCWPDFLNVCCFSSKSITYLCKSITCVLITPPATSQNVTTWWHVEKKFWREIFFGFWSVSWLRRRSSPGLPDFSWSKIPKRRKIYQITTKYTKWP
jgi:hypothetical protein